MLHLLAKDSRPLGSWIVVRCGVLAARFLLLLPLLRKGGAEPAGLLERPALRSGLLDLLTLRVPVFAEGIAIASSAGVKGKEQR